MEKQVKKSLPAEIKDLPGLVKRSCGEIKRIGSLTGAAMLAALNVILHQLTVIISLTQQISFAFITVGISGMLYGPMLTGMIGIATDILKYIVKPNGGFFPGFTLSEFVLGFIYGLFLYKKEVTLARVFCAQLTATLVIDLTLTSLWLSMMYGQAFIVLVGARLVKNIVMLPVKTAILYFLAKKVSEIRIRRLA